MSGGRAASTGSVLGSALRRALWRVVTFLAGGLAVSGRVPRGPGIVVANHTSHADTAIMFASLPARSRPFAVAAGDYWYGRWPQRLAAHTLVATVPVDRAGHADAGSADAVADPYGDLLAAVRPRVRSGALVILYPEGTRTTTGEVGDFKSGAARLAADLEVPLYPAAIKGVADVLPKGGRIAPHRMEIVFGDPVEVPSSDRRVVQDVSHGLRTSVVEMKDDDRPARTVSRRYVRTVGLVSSSALWALAFVWGFAEALFWPLVAETLLAFVVIVRPRRVLPAAIVLALGSAVGVCVHAWLVYHGVSVWRPLTTDRMYAQALADLGGPTGVATGEPGYFGVWHQLLSGIPVKEYAAVAGDTAREAGEPPGYWSLFGWTLLWRSARILVVGVVVAAVGVALRRILPRWYALLWWVGFAVLLALLRLVYLSWV